MRVELDVRQLIFLGPGEGETITDRAERTIRILLAHELLESNVVGNTTALEAGSAVFDLACVLASLGRSAELLEHIDRATVPNPWTEAAAAVTHGEWSRAADVYAEIGYLPIEAYTRLRAAEQLVAEGRRIEADEQLRKALSFFRSVCATRYVNEGETLLAATA